ncbi:MAG: Asp-tRNA(Asn)/Glu-tRNA(Gln) amidotransferase subunit GatC [Candidatus Aenigmarchaeota archaeon]|nr:Asp-tRNA(Asn)/Glu-tRNA(Gln) amidotransferase subunit GatC [Candidatus Aenigmarchaeota archaeon]MBU5689440.1 Asp-tRNA(Asn)/Glu-tRNA(Gln) amidotransferase subunit GatC [Candidatus Aenigmarchaeota archaeon]
MTDYWKIDEKLVNHICAAAKLELTEDEKKKYLKQLEEILQVFKEIDEVDTSSVEPSFHPIKIKNNWREDEEKKYEWDPLGNTRHKEDGYFKGPKIV